MYQDQAAESSARGAWQSLLGESPCWGQNPLCLFFFSYPTLLRMEAHFVLFLLLFSFEKADEQSLSGTELGKGKCRDLLGILAEFLGNSTPQGGTNVLSLCSPHRKAMIWKRGSLVKVRPSLLPHYFLFKPH